MQSGNPEFHTQKLKEMWKMFLTLFDTVYTGICLNEIMR